MWISGHEKPFENENGGKLTVTLVILLYQQIFVRTNYIYLHEIQSFFSRGTAPMIPNTSVIGYNVTGGKGLVNGLVPR